VLLYLLRRLLGFAFISVYYRILGRAKLNSSVFTVSKGGIDPQKGERLFLTRNRYLSPMCTVFLSGSSGQGLRSCVLATSYASGGKYSLRDWLNWYCAGPVL
jgi:hypothetical protein